LLYIIYRRTLISILVAAGLLLVAAGACEAITYANVTEITAVTLKNAVQITIKADGFLEWGSGVADQSSGAGCEIDVSLPGARSTVPNFIDVSKFPVSYIQVSVPQGAKDGVGLTVAIKLFESASFQVARSSEGQSLIVTVKSKRTLDEIDKSAKADGGDQKKEFECTCKDGLISLHVLKADMLKVLGKIAKASGLNIAVDDAVGRRVVSLSLDNTPAESVLQSIAGAYGLSLAKRDDVYMVSEGVPTDLATYRMSGTQSFPMQYVRAQTASGLLPTFLYSYLHVNNEQNALVVSAPTQMLEKIKSDLKKVDIAPPQIMIEAVVIESSAVNDLSLSLGLTGNNAHSTTSLDTATGAVSYTTVGKLPADFKARVSALVSEHKAKVDARPRMSVVNGQTADIFIGAQRFIRVQSPSYSGINSEYIQSVDVGTSISITPWTGGNGEITANISPEVSNVVELERATGLPTVASRKASTTVRVKDGETVVIGGLTQRQDYVTNRRIPFLGDIPLLGQLFRSKSKNSTKSDLVILITPRILADGGHLANQAEETKLKEHLMGSGYP